MIHYYHIFFIINVLLSDFQTVFYSFVVIFIAFDKKSATLQCTTRDKNLCRQFHANENDKQTQNENWEKWKRVEEFYAICDLFFVFLIFLFPFSFFLFLSLLRWQKQKRYIFHALTSNKYVCVWICNRYCFECDIFCGCWMNYENECNSPFRLLSWQHGIWHISLFIYFPFYFYFLMDFLNDDAHTIIMRMCARLNNKGASPISIIDAFAINVMCARDLNNGFSNAFDFYCYCFRITKLVFFFWFVFFLHFFFQCWCCCCFHLYFFSLSIK